MANLQSGSMNGLISGTTEMFSVIDSNGTRVFEPMRRVKIWVTGEGNATFQLHGIYTHTGGTNSVTMASGDSEYFGDELSRITRITVSSLASGATINWRKIA